jgi:uncharacterized protein (TIGR02246 family)
MKAIAVCAPLLLATASAALAKGPADEASIRMVEDGQAEAWNRHAIADYAALFTPDAHVINVLGWQWRSRAELEQKLGAGFKTVFARSQLAIGEVTVEFVTSDVAVAHVRWTMTGALSPTGSGANAPERGIQTQVLVKVAGVWKIRDFQNTNSVPETAFPPTR